MIIKWIARLASFGTASSRSAPTTAGVTNSPSAPPRVRDAPSFDQTPDYPQSFGYKISWFALKTSDPASVLNALEIGDATPSNWESGLAAVYASRGNDWWLFVSPSINGWVLAVSTAWAYPVAIEAQCQGEYQHGIGGRFDVLFSRLMKKLDDVQFFGGHRVSDFVTWARALKGKPIRIFGWCGSDGAVLVNVGEQTPEEAKLGFLDLSGLSPSDAGEKIFAVAEEQSAEEDALVTSGLSRKEALAKRREKGRSAFPGEEDVTDLAELWSIDPTEAWDQDDPLALGLAARLPNDLAQ
jgi:hypothetical protein